MARVHGNESMRALADERGGDCINYMHIARSTKHDRMDGPAVSTGRNLKKQNKRTHKIKQKEQVTSSGIKRIIATFRGSPRFCNSFRIVLESRALLISKFRFHPRHLISPFDLNSVCLGYSIFIATFLFPPFCFIIISIQGARYFSRVRSWAHADRQCFLIPVKLILNSFGEAARGPAP
jgi:hypothetical protein